MQNFLTRAADSAQKTLARNRDKLEELVVALLDKESLGRNDLEEILGTRKSQEMVETTAG